MRSICMQPCGVFSSVRISNFTLRRTVVEERGRKSRNFQNVPRRDISPVLFCNKRGSALHPCVGEHGRVRTRARETRYYAEIRSTFVQHRSYLIEMIYELYFFLLFHATARTVPPPPSPPSSNTRSAIWRRALSRAPPYFSTAKFCCVPCETSISRTGNPQA